MEKLNIKSFYLAITLSLLITSVSISDASDSPLYYGAASVTSSNNYAIINFNNEKDKSSENPRTFLDQIISQSLEKIAKQNNFELSLPSSSKQLPIKKVALGISFDDSYDPLSIKILMHLPSSKDKLSKISSGDFTFDTVLSAITGISEKSYNNPSAEAETYTKAERSSIEDVYLVEDVAMTALPEEGILVLGLFPEDVSDAVSGVKDKKFGGIARSFDEEDFCISQLTVRDMFDPSSEPIFIKTEYALAEKPYGFDIKQWSNLYELFPELEKTLPADADSLPLFGKGHPYFFAHMVFGTELLKSILKLSGLSWEYLAALFESFNEYGIEAKDIENLISKSLSVVSGVDASLMGSRLPGAYICLGGSDNSAGKLIKAVKNYCKDDGFLKDTNVSGWDAVLTTTESIPVSITIGQKGDNLLLGLIDPASLTDKPDLDDKMKGIMSESGYLSYSYLDFELFWSQLRAQFRNGGLMPILLGAWLPQDVLNAFMKLADTEPPVKSLTSKNKQFNMSVVQVETNKENEAFIAAFAELLSQWLENITGDEDDEDSDS